MNGKPFRCSVCERSLFGTPPGSITTGFGRNGSGHRVCYACCADADIAWMWDKGRIALYLVERNGIKHVTNGPGSLSFPVAESKRGRHNIGGTRTDVWFRGPDGFMWWGVNYGDDTQICHCKRTRVRWARPRG